MISSNIFTKDDFILIRQPHVNDDYISKIYCDIYRSNNVKVKKNITHIDYYYDKYMNEFYLLSYDKTQKINRPIKISQYKFYPILYQNLIKFVKLD